MPRRAHKWFVIIWLSATAVIAVILASRDGPDEVDPGNSILLAIFFVLLSCGLLSVFMWMFLRYREQSGYPANAYGLWDFIKEPAD